MSINLEKLSPQELDALISAAAEQKRRLHRERQAEVRARLIALAKEEGYTIEELFSDGRGKARSPQAGRSVPAKYRNPDSPSETWSGRGKRPRWFSAALAAGKQEADLLIR